MLDPVTMEINMHWEKDETILNSSFFKICFCESCSAGGLKK